MRTLTRRDFIKLGTVSIGGVMLAGCRGEQIVKVTATPVPTIGAQPATPSAALPRPTSLPAIMPPAAPSNLHTI